MAYQCKKHESSGSEGTCPMCKAEALMDQEVLDRKKERDEQVKRTEEIRKDHARRRKQADRKDAIKRFIPITFYAVWLILILGFWFIGPIFEARTFNKFNPDAQKATYVDALFANLRVTSE